jgi:hypothetical protein
MNEILTWMPSWILEGTSNVGTVAGGAHMERVQDVCS